MPDRLDPAGFEIYPNIVRTSQKVEKAIRDEGCHVIVEKQVKSGARKLIEALAARNKEYNNKKIEHIFLTKLDRTDINEQLDEMELYGLKISKIQKQSSLTPLFEFTDKSLSEGNIVWCHFDESDYGTDYRQLLSKFFYHYIDNDNIYFIDYSATNQEAILSSYNNQDYIKIIALEPGEHFKGSEWYLEQGLVLESGPFWDFSTQKPTEQGNECINLLLNSEKLFGIVRFAGGKSKEGGSNYNSANRSKVFKDYFSALGIYVRFVDTNNKFIWGNRPGADWKSFCHDKQKTLIIINQTCTRSTELAFHEYIAFWHDHRPGKTPFNTRSQAYERVNHYHPIGHKILIYAHIPTFKLSAKIITINQYVTTTGLTISERVSNEPINRQQKWIRQFFIEDDPVLICNMSNKEVPWVSFTDGRTVPEGYEHIGSSIFKSTRVSRWNPNKRIEDPLYRIIQGMPRSITESMIYIDGPNQNPKGKNNTLTDADYEYRKDLYLSYWNEFTEWLRINNVKAEDGRSVLEALIDGNKVFYHAKPTGISNTGKTALTNTKSMFSKVKRPEDAS